MAILRMVTGSHGRVEDGEHVIYKRGDTFEGTDRDVQHLVHQVGSAEVVEDTASAPEEPEPVAPAGDAVQALDGTVKDVETFIASVNDADVLERLRQQESSGKDRVGVYNAIDERLAGLEG